MLLFQRQFHEGLRRGEITRTFRRWKKPHVRAGGRYRCHPIGVLEVDAVRRVSVREIGSDDAERSGFASREALIAYLAELGPLAEDDPLFRIDLHYGGDGDRVEIALETNLSKEDVETIRTRLERMDRERPWTAETLALIETHPRTVASKLAKMLGRETAPFKADVRKLKRLGLTQSFEIGYEISPRGRAYLDAIRG